MAELLEGAEVPRECSICSEGSTHSILIREGVRPDNPDDPKTPDRSRVTVVSFCGKHWQGLLDYLAQIDSSTTGGP